MEGGLWRPKSVDW